MITMLVTLIIAVLLIAVLWWALSTLPIPEPVKTIILVVVCLLVVLMFFTVGPFRGVVW